MNQQGENQTSALFKPLKMSCKDCFGLCCVALYYAASEGFPSDKPAGKPCSYLDRDFKCKIHTKLSQKGFHGCLSYECMGAGQKVAQHTYQGKDWHQQPKRAKEMYDVFLVMKSLHEFLWYLSDAFVHIEEKMLREQLQLEIKAIEKLTYEAPKILLAIDIEKKRDEVNGLLHQASKVISQKARAAHGITSPLRPQTPFAWMGKDLRRKILVGADLSGTLLIAANLSGIDLTGANLIGADLRDTHLEGAHLEKALFLTQLQIDTAKGDAKTTLPPQLECPSHWL